MADGESQPPSKPHSLQALTAGPVASSVAKLSGSSRVIPSDQDFHFYSNFDEFRNPMAQIAGNSQSMLDAVGSSAFARGGEGGFLEDTEEAYHRLVDVNDAILERFDASVDEFRGKDGGFQVVTGKKKRAAKSGADEVTDVKVATIDKKVTGPKPKVPFHIPTIKRPQEEFSIYVNNGNVPFEHVWLQRAEEGDRYVHPLESVLVLDFVDDSVPSTEPSKPPSLESTAFKLVVEVKDLKELAAKLRGVDEFAVDLEHNHYRSFQGLTCLIQISTRTEDFVIDALKLRVHIGPYLREVFKDPTKRKVMHGADRDVVWLQRDFGIYICNLFDTGQASRVLNLERNSLEYLLQHYCGVTANKEYQTADWRLRPLPEEMIRYAREDTHYLLHIYDLMRVELLSMSTELENRNASLVEVYKRGSDICMQLYEKELLTEDSYLYIYGLQGMGLNSQQLAIVSGLCEWRDAIARAEDESTGFILPNKTLLEIAKQMPGTTSKLRRVVKSKHPYVDHNLGSIVSIIRKSMQNAEAFEAAVSFLNEERVAKVPEETSVVNEETGDSKTTIASAEAEIDSEFVSTKLQKDDLGISSEHSVGSRIKEIDSTIIVKDDLRASEPIKDQSLKTSLLVPGEVNGATVQVQKKPTRAFGALFGNTTAKKRFDLLEKDEQEGKLKQIRASVQFPFHPLPKTVADPPATTAPISESNGSHLLPIDSTEARPDDLKTDIPKALDSEIDQDEPMSLADLSRSFQQCYSSKKATEVDKALEAPGSPLKPFDYEAARKQVVFGDQLPEANTKGRKGGKTARGPKVNKSNKTSDDGEAAEDDEDGEFGQGRRRKAFPATGNRSATFL